MDWRCRQSGDCCRAAAVVVMTPGEFAAVRAVDDREVGTRLVSGGRLEVFNLHGTGCPYYASGCAVYAVRPGVCRAWGCFRKGTEPYRDDLMLTRMAESAGVRRVALRMVGEGEQWTKEVRADGSEEGRRKEVLDAD